MPLFFRSKIIEIKKIKKNKLETYEKKQAEIGDFLIELILKPSKNNVAPYIRRQISANAYNNFFFKIEERMLKKMQ